MRLLAGSALVAAALTSPVGPAHADCDVVGTTANCTGNGTITDGITNQGLTPDFTSPPVEFINVFNITGNIAPVADTIGIDAQTTAANSPLTIFIDTAPFEIITENAAGISAQTSNTNSPITLTNWAAITTEGTNADGIVAETLELNSTITLTNRGAISTQGDGSDGIAALTFGPNNTIELTNHGAITTEDIFARGIRAQVGAPNSTIDLTNWGTISTQRNFSDGIAALTIDSDSTITLTNHGAITTEGEEARGIFAETRERDSKIILTNHGAITTEDEAARGIFAETGGDGSDITLTNGAAITTAGTTADGIVAQTFGTNSTIDLTNHGAITTQDFAANGVVAVANFANSEITLTNHGAITTEDESARGIFAQARQSNSKIDLTNWGVITTQVAAGIFARTYDLNSTIDLTNHGAITTKGEEAHGIVAEARGSNSMISLTNWGKITTQGETAAGISAQTSDPNSTIDLTNRGAITTQAGSAFGIHVATSGLGSTIDLTNHRAITTQGGSAFGIFAEISGPNSTIDLTNHRAITTQGGSAFGIFARSLDSNNTIDLTNHGAITTQAGSAFGIYVATSGLDNTIDLTNHGAITTQGSGANGILAQSLQPNGTIDLTNWADVIANGTDASGIVAQAQGATSTVTVNLHGGLVQGGTGDGDGVELDNVAGAISTLNVFAGATVTTLGANAVAGFLGDDTVNNWGIVTGDVNLRTGTNAFNNMVGGLFNAGTTVNLGGTNLLTNAGTLSPGGLNTVVTTELTGSYQQSATGIFNVDVDFASNRRDQLDVIGGGTAELNGLVVPNLFIPQAVTPGAQGAVLILTTTGAGVTDNGITAQDTAVVDYELLFNSGATDQVFLTGFVDFVPAGLNQNQTAVAETVSAIQAAGGSAAFAPVVGGLLTVPDLASLADAYDQLGPQAYLGNGITTLFSTLGFTDDLMSCEVREGGNVFIREGQCLWAEATGNWFDQDRTGETVDFDQVAPRIAGGFQAALAPDWRFGMAFGYQRSSLDALNERQDSKADTLHGGAVLKYLFGDALLAAAVSGGHGWYDTRRNLAFGGFAAQADASHGISHLTGRLRGAYAFTNGTYYVKPLVDLNVSWIGIDGFAESGGGGAALIVDRTDETVLSASPALEFGWQYQAEDGTLFRPYVRAGVTVFDDPELTLTSSFAAAPAGSPGFRTAMGTDDVVGEIAVGLDLLTPDGTVLKAFYESQFGEDTSQQLAGIRASRPF